MSMTQARLEEFAKELNALLHKYGLCVYGHHGPMLFFKEARYGSADYSAMQGRCEAGPNRGGRGMGNFRAMGRISDERHI